MKNSLIIGLVAVLLSACIDPDEFNFDNLAKTSWNPEVGFPVVNSVIGVDKLFENTDTNVVTSDNDGLVILQYTTPDIVMSADEMLDIPTTLSVSTQAIPVAPGLTVPLNVPVTPTSVALAMQVVDFESGLIRLGFNTGSSQLLTYTFSSIVDGGGNPLVVQVPMNVASIDRDLDGYTMTLNSNGEIEFTIQFPPGSSGSAIPVFEVLEMEFARIQGDFGQFNVTLPKDSIKLHMFKNLNRQGKFTVSSPSLEITLTNGIGIPLNLDLSSMVGHNTVTSDRVNVFSSGGVFPVDQASVNLPKVTKLIIDKSNSDLSAVIQPTPVYVEHTSVISTNPGGSPSPLNSIEKGAELSLGAMLRLPLHGSISDLAIVDTAAFTVDEMFDYIEEFVIATKIKNGFPFDIDLSLQLLDSAYTPILTTSNNPVYLMYKQRIFSSGTPDSDGRIDQSNVVAFSNKYTVDQELLESVVKGKYVRIVGEIATFNGGNDVIKVFDDYELSVKLGVKVTGNINF